MKETRYILPILLLLLGGCSSDETEIPVPSSRDGQPLEFRAFVGSKEGEPVSESGYFKDGDQIRIYTPVSYTVPSFTDGSPGMYVYEYKETKETDEFPYKFVPLAGTEGFNWQNLQPTAEYYFFEALHFPGKNYLEEIPDRQDKPYPDPDAASEFSISGLDAADMLIAHSKPVTDEKEKPVQLTFHHAFAMVEVTVEIPASKTPSEGPFPEDALQEVYMRQMLTRYTVNYSNVIADHGLRSVLAVDTDERKDVYMKKDNLSDKENFFEDQNNVGEKVRYQRHVYRGIVPQQNFLDEGRDFLYFKVHRYNNTGIGEYLYKFTYIGNTFSLKSSHILKLKLRIDEDSNELVVVTAEVKPWIKADGEFEILPEK